MKGYFWAYIIGVILVILIVVAIEILNMNARTNDEMYAPVFLFLQVVGTLTETYHHVVILLLILDWLPYTRKRATKKTTLKLSNKEKRVE